MSEVPLVSLERVQRYEQIPWNQRVSQHTIPELLETAAERYGERVAIDLLLTGERGETPVSTTYRELHDSVMRAHQLLRDLGFGRGCVLSLLLPVLPEAQVLAFAAQCSGIANPLNPHLEAEHLAGIINTTGACTLAACAPELDPESWPRVQSLLRQCPGIRHLLLIGPPGVPLDLGRYTGIPDGVSLHDYHARLAQTPALPLAQLPQADDIAAYFHTGGTTGRPKIAQLSQGNFAFVAQVLEPVTGLPSGHILLNGLPLFHIYGAMVAGLGSFVHGNRVVHLTPSGFRTPAVVHNFWHLVDAHRANSVPLVPTLFGLLMDADCEGLDISCLWEMGSGAAPLAQGLKGRFEQRFQVRIVEGYGMTESCCLIARSAGSTAPDCPAPAGSVGVRLPYTRVRVASLAGGEVSPLAPGQVGNILIGGPNVFQGYLEEADNRCVWHRGASGERWFDTGDCGYLDTEGCLFITGRAKDLIIRGGHNIDPALIEEPLRGHRCVAEVVAVGMPDPHAGELPVVFVQRRADATASAEELLAFAAAHIHERAAVPKRVFFVEQMPLTAVGKIFKPELRRRALESSALEQLAQAGLRAQVRALLDSGCLRLDVEVEAESAAPVEQLLGQLPVPLAVVERQI